jgi:hypothetical protein
MSPANQRQLTALVLHAERLPGTTRLRIREREPWRDASKSSCPSMAWGALSRL